MLYFLEPDVSGEAPFPELHCDYVRPRGLSALLGEHIAGRLPKLTFNAIDGAECSSGIPDFTRTVGYCIISTRMRRVLEENLAEVEYLPCDIVYRGRCISNQYYVANPLRKIRGVDLERSSIELDEVGIALGVERLVLNESLFAGTPLALLHETVSLVVQPGLMSAINDGDLVGCSFVDPCTVQF